METKPSVVLDASETGIPDSKALLWGNNAAWICVGCGELLGNRTGDADYAVECGCGLRYEIQRAPNRNGSLNLGRAVGVRRAE